MTGVKRSPDLFVCHLSSRSGPLECPSQTFHLYSEVSPHGPTMVLTRMIKASLILLIDPQLGIDLNPDNPFTFVLSISF